MKFIKQISKTYVDKKFKRFFVLNFILIALCNLFILYLNNGNKQNIYPWETYILMLTISIIIIFIQYPILRIKKNWYYKTLIFYLSILFFLFVFGITETIHLTKQLNLGESLKMGLILTIIGQLFGGIFLFPFIVTINWFFNQFIFE